MGEGMKLRWLRAFIVLTAALIVCISNMVLKRPVLDSLIWLLVVIIVFYVIGSIVTRVIQRTMKSGSEQEPVVESSGQDADGKDDEETQEQNAEESEE